MAARRSVGRALTLVVLLPGLVLAGLTVGAGAASAQKIRSDFWGMHDNNWGNEPTVPVGSANFTTTGTYWTSIESTLPGVYDWERLDDQVAAAEAVGAQPMIVLGRTPRFHSSAPTSADFSDHMPTIAGWRNFVEALADRYGTRLDYQIWPEPNNIGNWQGTPGQMATLTMVAAEAIAQNAGKEARVVSPAVALRLKSQQKWTVQYFKKKVGGKPVHAYVDAIALDPFPHHDGTPEDSYALIRSIKKRLAKLGIRKPLWNNEINYGVTGSNEPSTANYSSAKEQAYVIRTYALSAAAGVQRTYWFGWFDSDTLGITMAEEDGTPLPPARAYEVVHSWINKTNFRGCKQKKGLWTCTTNKGKETRRVYWKVKGTTTIKTPRSTKRVEDQTGNVVAKRGARKLRVTFRPVMVASRK